MRVRTRYSPGGQESAAKPSTWPEPSGTTASEDGCFTPLRPQSQRLRKSVPPTVDTRAAMQGGSHCPSQRNTSCMFQTGFTYTNNAAKVSLDVGILTFLVAKANYLLHFLIQIQKLQCKSFPVLRTILPSQALDVPSAEHCYWLIRSPSSSTQSFSVTPFSLVHPVHLEGTPPRCTEAPTFPCTRCSTVIRMRLGTPWESMEALRKSASHTTDLRGSNGCSLGHCSEAS